MLLLDLELLLFAVLVAVGAAILIAVWIDRRIYRQREGCPVANLADATLHSVIDRAPLGLLLLDKEGLCCYANAYARTLLQLKPPPAAFPDAAWVPLLAEDQTAIHSQSLPGERYRSVSIHSDQGIRWWITTCQEWDVVVVQDVTAQQRAEHNARTLFSNLSHELRTPLATLLTHLEVLRIPKLTDETRQQSISLMQSEANYMVRLVHNFLELGRLEARTEIERRPVDLLSVVEDVLNLFRLQAEAQEVILSLQADAPLPPVIGDKDLLRQLLLNLLDNAIKYVYPGNRVDVLLQQQRGGVVCSVCDNGPGIPAEHLPHITQRFYRVDPNSQKEGTGLGLALALEIVRRHQSTLDIESRSDGDSRGTCVRFLLPTLEQGERQA